MLAEALSSMFQLFLQQPEKKLRDNSHISAVGRINIVLEPNLRVCARTVTVYGDKMIVSVHRLKIVTLQGFRGIF